MRSVLALIFAAPLAAADAGKPTFDDDVKAVLAQHCMGCHGNDKQKGGLNVATFAATMAGGSSGAVVTPGDPDKSRLYSLSAHKEEPKMPPNAARIPDAQLELLRKWVEQGGRENSGSKVSVAKPKVEIALKSVTKGRPAGPPPMPAAGKYPTEPAAMARRPGAVLALAASPWAPLVAVAGQKQVFLYNSDSGALLGILPVEFGQVTTLKFSRNGGMLLAAGGRGGQAGRAALYDVATGKKIVEVGLETDAILAADVSADLSQIAVGGPSKILRTYSTADGSVIREVKKHTDWITAVEFSPDGVLLASGDRNGGLFVWEGFTGREYFSLRNHTAMITDLSWRDDANVLASSSEDGTIRLWEMENGGNIKGWGAHGGGAASVKYSHDGRLISTGRDKVTKIWDQNGGMQKQYDALPDIGLRTAVTHDTVRIVSGDWGGNLKAWVVADGKPAPAPDANPPTAAEKLARAKAALAAAEAKVAAATAAVTAAKVAADKAAAELAAPQKAVADTTVAANATKAAEAPLKADADKWAAAVAAAQAAEAAKAVAAGALAEAANKVAVEAAKAPANAELKAQAANIGELAKAAVGELEAAKKATAAAAVAAKVAADKFAAGVQASAATAAARNAAQKKLAADQAARKPALDAAAAAQAALTAAQTELAAAKATVPQAAAK